MTVEPTSLSNFDLVNQTSSFETSTTGGSSVTENSSSSWSSTVETTTSTSTMVYNEETGAWEVVASDSNTDISTDGGASGINMTSGGSSQTIETVIEGGEVQFDSSVSRDEAEVEPIAPVEPAAPVEPVAPAEPVVDPFNWEIIDYTNVWSEAEINQWVETNFGGDSWAAISDKHLFDADARDAFALEITTRLVNTWSQTISGMPPVCAEGKKCRDEAFGDLMVNLKADFDSMLDTINLTMTGAKNASRLSIDNAYQEAWACDPDCYCENIHIEYDEVVKTQKELINVIEQLRITMSELEANQYSILEHCEEYKEIDGTVFYSFD